VPHFVLSRKPRTFERVGTLVVLAATTATTATTSQDGCFGGNLILEKTIKHILRKISGNQKTRSGARTTDSRDNNSGRKQDGSLWVN
jgi:hypothetical protein